MAGNTRKIPRLIAPRQDVLPVEPVEQPILCNPYEEPRSHRVYDKERGWSVIGERRPASYWYKTERTGSAQLSLLAEEQRDDLPLVNELRKEDHAYEPDFLVRLGDGTTVVLEIKGYEDDQTRAKHDAAKRWVTAVNNWKRMGKWAFHVCRDPQVLGGELERLASCSGKL